MNALLFIVWLVISLHAVVYGKIHYLSLRSDARRNILLTKFGYDVNGTFDFHLSNFTVPDEVLKKTETIGEIGFTLSRGNVILEGTRSNPRLCQLEQTDQNLDVIFFKVDFNDPPKLDIIRTGGIRSIKLCPNLTSCYASDENVPVASTEEPGFIQKLLNFNKKSGIAYRDYIPLVNLDGQYSANFATKFSAEERGLYTFMYHNCFNYHAHGYSDRVAVDFTVNIIEKNVNSYLSAGDIPKPQLYLYFAFLFMLATFMWINALCKSPKNVYRVHKLMTALVFLKTLSLFFHGINYYFVGTYGHQKEIWAVVYYITHLLKGALLFGTIILIGTGYTFFKNFLSDRDRNLFMIILPLQVADNIAMIIIEESEFGEQRYYFWFEIFIFLDLVCCMAIIFPVIWSMRHLQEGARTDGKAAFNLQKLKLFRHFYIIVISYIYLTRVSKFLVELVLPFNSSWVSELIVESSTFIFFCLVGYKFRPVKQNPYLKLSQESSDDEEAVALTKNGIFETVSRVQRITVQDEIDDIPGTIGGRDSSDEDEDVTLLPKTGRDMALSTL